MFDKKQIDETVQKLIDSLPSSVRNLKEDLEKNFRIVLQNTFAKMNLVTREEFDSQVLVLQRTREKLEKLEQKITELQKSKE